MCLEIFDDIFYRLWRIFFGDNNKVVEWNGINLLFFLWYINLAYIMGDSVILNKHHLLMALDEILLNNKYFAIFIGNLND